MSGIVRCEWAGSDPLYRSYHDKEWGVPVHEDQRLFEMLILEGMQAGLSWSTILRKRETFRTAFDNFSVQVVSAYSEEKIANLLSNPGIVRNRKKVESAVRNAVQFMRIQEEFGSFDGYVWQYVAGKPIQNSWRSMSEIPAETEESRALSQDLKKRGFNFVGPTICYAFMQAVGMVNDHIVDCFRYDQILAYQ